jgi:hypothetical protein
MMVKNLRKKFKHLQWSKQLKISIIMNNKPTEWKIQDANNQNKKHALFKEDSLQIIFKYHIKMETIKIKNY